MIENVTYTDKIVNEILNEKVNNTDLDAIINDKYEEKGFTLLGVRKERRIVKERISDNAVNKFDVITAVSLCIISGVVSYLLGDKVFAEGSSLKVLFPVVVLSILSMLFSSIIITMRDRKKIYSICNEDLLTIERELEEEFAKEELRKMLDEDYISGNIFNSESKENKHEEVNKIEEEKNDDIISEEKEEDIEIESFEFNLPEENKETQFGVA